MRNRRSLEKILVEMGAVTENQLNHAKTIHEKTSEDLGDVLVKQNVISKKVLTQAIAKDHEFEFCDVANAQIQKEALRLIPEEQCKRYTILPVSLSGNTLKVALADPLNIIALDNLRMFLGKEIVGMLAPEEDIEQAIAKYYGTDAKENESSSQQSSGEGFKVTEKDEEQILKLISMGADDLAGDDAPVIRLVAQLILGAFEKKASDIHVEPFSDRLRIRYRIDGICHDVKTIPKNLQGSVVSRLKIMAHLDIAEKRLPQDGRIKLKISDKDVDFRVSTVPSIHGESVVLRILDRAQLLLQLSDLGFRKREEEIFNELIHMPNGVILVTGPTGSGKTTTLYTALNSINSPNKKIITVEDPIEYQLSGVNQVQVRPSIGLTFSSALRSILRQAPNIIMIGEIRDVETARIAIESSLTGHLVFSTLHTNDAPGAIIRLIDMGVKSYLVASAVQAILAQRLVRCICPNCKEKVSADKQILKSLGLEEKVEAGALFYKGKGCDACSHTGYKGRIALFELFRVNDTIQELIYKKSSRTELRERARQNGMRTLREDGVEKALSGVTTLEEVLRVTQSDTD